MTTTRALTVAAVQMRSLPGQLRVNTAHADPLIERAASRGARLVVLPELFSSGYQPSSAVWAAAEPPNGPTAHWLTATARRLSICLGAGAVETNGTDICNAFLLAGPEGDLVGRAVKANAEANVFRRGLGEHVVDTPIGRLGIGICADNQLAAHLRLMRERQVDLVLMPHAWPTPYRASGPVSDVDVATHQRRMVELPALYAAALGVPVIFVNQIGPLQPIGGMLGRLMDPRVWRLRGQSRIVDSDGTVLDALEEDEGVVVATVHPDPRRKHWHEPPSYAGYLQPGPRMVRKLIIPLDTAIGRAAYMMSRQRRRMARVRARPGYV
jgi:N-carbamoylputrescine amidase